MEDGGEEFGELQALLACLDASQGEPGTTHFLEDLDGEPWILRERCLSMVRIPKCLVLPFESGAPREGDDTF